MKVGDKASVTRVFTETDVRGFADITWDTNPLHIDNEFAKNTRFSKPVVNGVFSLGLVFYSNYLLVVVGPILYIASLLTRGTHLLVILISL